MRRSCAGVGATSDPRSFGASVCPQVSRRCWAYACVRAGVFSTGRVYPMSCTLLTTMPGGITTSAFLKHIGQETVNALLVLGESSRSAMMLSCVLQIWQGTTCEWRSADGIGV